MSFPGGLAFVELGIPETADQPQVKLGDREIAAFAKNGKWYAVVGVALTTEPGTHSLSLIAGRSSSQIDFQVNQIEYEEQRICFQG